MNILTDDQMVAVLTDLHIVEGSVVPLQLMGDSITQFIIDNYGYVFEKNNIKDTQFKQSLQYYVERPRRLDKIYERVIDNLSKMQSEIKN